MNDENVLAISRAGALHACAHFIQVIDKQIAAQKQSLTDTTQLEASEIGLMQLRRSTEMFQRSIALAVKLQ